MDGEWVGGLMVEWCVCVDLCTFSSIEMCGGPKRTTTITFTSWSGQRQSPHEKLLPTRKCLYIFQKVGSPYLYPVLFLRPSTSTNVFFARVEYFENENMEGKAADVKHINAIGDILNDVSKPLKQRFRALFTLRNIGGPTAIDCIAKCFGDSSELLKHECAFCLGQMQDATAVPILVGLLKDQKECNIVRHEAGTETQS